MKIAVAVLVLVALACVAAKHHNRKTVAATSTLPYGWKMLGAASDFDQVSFHILLKQQNFDVVMRRFEEVSDPSHSNYGKHLTRAQIEEIIRPAPAVFESFAEWLAPFANDMTVKVHAEVIKVDTFVHVARRLFQVDFARFQKDKTRVVRIDGAASMPSDLAKHIDFVAGMSEFIVDNLHTTKYAPRKATAPGATGITITPAIIKQYYKIPSTLTASNKKSYQGIAAFQDYFSLGALAAFDQAEKIPAPNVTRLGPNCLASGCDQGESDLDVQYITAIAENVPTMFINQAGNYWVLQFCLDVETEMNPAPYVFSISYGWSELAQCDIAVANCPKFGYDSIQYVERTNQEFVKIGAMGISVLVADGDDGAPGLGASSGNCPLDPSVYCPMGGCAHTSSQCQAFTITNSSGDIACLQFPMGLGMDSCQGFLNDPNANAALQAFVKAQPSNCKFAVEQDSQQEPQIYSACPCTQIKPLTSHGYTFQAYKFVQSVPVFTADYPTSSPYVTSVGASMFTGSMPNPTEIVASILTGAIITGGGGFSSFQPQPSYQAAAVAAYVSSRSTSLTPSWSFNASNRGYPDVTFNGHNYLIYMAQHSDKCPCQAVNVDGTSCASPAFAGIVTLLNDYLLNHGKSTLGFLNPLLYSLAGNSNVFNDITSGNNRCNRGYCCIYGFGAQKGWDPASGLGSPNYQGLLNALNSIHGIQA